MVPEDRRLSYEELAAVVMQQSGLIERLQAEIAELRAENAELKRRSEQNSRNSSRPLSSDSPFAMPMPKSLRGKSGKKPGGQPGQPGSRLALVDDPDERKQHEPGLCMGSSQPVYSACPSRSRISSHPGPRTGTSMPCAGSAAPSTAKTNPPSTSDLDSCDGHSA